MVRARRVDQCGVDVDTDHVMAARRELSADASRAAPRVEDA